MESIIADNKEKSKYLKQLHNLGLSLFPIEPNSKIPLLIKKTFSINNPFIQVQPNEKIINGKITREYRMKRKRYIHKPMSWQTIKKYIKKDCNFALLTGQQTEDNHYTAILDFDLKGEKAQLKKELFAQWLNNHPKLKNYPMHQTPSGGFQFIFFSPYKIKKQNIYLSGIHIGEILADGAYGLLPYSTIDNNSYLSINSLIDNDIPVIDITSLNFDKIDYLYNNKCNSYCVTSSKETTVNHNIEKKYTITIRWNKENYYQALLKNNYKRIQHAQPGNRNNTLYEQTRMAFAVGRELGFELHSIESFKKAAILAGLDEKEVNATFESAKEAENRVKIIFSGLKIRKQWAEKEKYKKKIGSSIEAFEWFRTHICRTIKGEGILQEEFKQGYLSSTTSQEKLGNMLGVTRQTINKWIKEWIDKGWCIKITKDYGWCYRFGEIIEGIVHWFIDEIKQILMPELKTFDLTDNNKSVFLINKEIILARGPD